MQQPYTLLQIGNEGFSLTALSQWDYTPKRENSQSAIQIWLIGREEPRVYRGIQADLIQSYLKISCHCLQVGG